MGIICKWLVQLVHVVHVVPTCYLFKGIVLLNVEIHLNQDSLRRAIIPPVARKAGA
jgi:hypothetical protein